MKDTLSRKTYADVIANEIKERYEAEKVTAENTGKERENLIFAISGKWREGKSTLLELLEIPLKEKGFNVILFNAWKYSQEDITLKRAFLRKIKDHLKSEVDLDDIYWDRSKTTFKLRDLWGRSKEILVGFFTVLIISSLA